MRHNWNIANCRPNKIASLFVMFWSIKPLYCIYCIFVLFIHHTSAWIAQPQLSFILKILTVSSCEIHSWKCLSVNLKKTDMTLRLKNSIIQQGEFFYSTGKTTTNSREPSISVTGISEPRVHPIPVTSHCILWGSPISFPMHRAEWQAVWVASGPGQGSKAYHCTDRQEKTPCLRDVPSLAPRGQRSESLGSLGGSFLTVVIHKQPTQMVFIKMHGQSEACWQRTHPQTEVDRGKSHTNTNTLNILADMLQVFAVVWRGEKVRRAVDSIISEEMKCENNRRVKRITVNFCQDAESFKVQSNSPNSLCTHIRSIQLIISSSASLKVGRQLNMVHSDRVAQQCEPFYFPRSTSPLYLT